MIDHLEILSTSIHKESPEAAVQLAKEQEKKEKKMSKQKKNVKEAEEEAESDQTKKKSKVNIDRIFSLS